MDKKYAEYLLVKTRRDFNKIAEDFSKTRLLLWRELAPLANYARPGERVLDLGCGNGRLFSFLKDKKLKYIGVDSSKELIELAKSRYQEGKPEFLLIEALNLPFRERFFDKIYTIAVFHHIPSEDLRLQFLQEAKRVLKSKGLLILTVWNLWQKKDISWLLLKYTILRIFGKSKLDFGDIFYPWKDSEGKVVAQRYFHCFRKKELGKLVKKAGFKIKEIGFTSRGRVKQANLYLVAEK